jgi:hypothetical protein
MDVSTQSGDLLSFFGELGNFLLVVVVRLSGAL